MPFIYGEQKHHYLVVWTLAEDGYIQGLDKVLDAYGDFLKAAPSIVLGDFNANAIWDNPNRSSDFSRVAHHLGSEFGLRSAYHTFFGENYGSENSATHYFRWHEDEPFHIDYCFVPLEWIIERVEVGKYSAWGHISDHCPLIVDISLPIAGK